MTTVHLGYFENFKFNDTLLIDGDHEGLEQLGSELVAFAEGEEKAVAINDLPYVISHQEVRLLAHRSESDLGVHRNGSCFEWHRTKEGWISAVEAIRIIARGNNVHEYLDAPNDEVTVMVSIGEYGEDWWEANG